MERSVCARSERDSGTDKGRRDVKGRTADFCVARGLSVTRTSMNA